MAKTVLYVSSSSGVNVRDAAAGNKVRALFQGTLMIHDSSDAPVKKALNGTTYTWLKVTYYYKGGNDAYLYATKETGWVTEENTAKVSTTKPSKSSVYTEDKSYKQNERLVNARYICNYLRSLSSDIRWSVNAICAMLGNMDAESGMSPGSWEETNNKDKGYGLVHWTPASKYLNTLSTGQSKTDIDLQLKRILAEVDGTYSQWAINNHSPALSFKNFTQSVKTVKSLAEYFLRCYEQPTRVTENSVSERSRNAQKWYDVLSALGDI